MFSLIVVGIAGYLFYRRTIPVLKHLDNSEVVHRSIFENAHDAIVMVDKDMTIMSVNPEVQNLFGYKEDELIGESVQIFIPSAFRPRHIELARQSVIDEKEGPMSGVREVWALHKKGYEIPVDISLSKITVDGKVMFSALMRDISDRKKAEKLQDEIKEELEQRVNERTVELTENNHRLNKEIEKRKHVEAELIVRDRAMTATSNGVLITDNRQPDNPIIYVNPGFEKITGYHKEEILGKNCRFLQGEDTEQAGLNILRQAIEAGEDCKVTIRNYRADGEMFWNQLSISPVFDEQNAISHFIGIQEDITTQKIQAEENENLALVVENTSNSVVIVNYEGVIQWTNDSFSRFMDIDIQNMNSLKITELGSEIKENIIQLSQLKKAINDQYPIKIELKLYDLLGKVVWIELNMQPVFSDYGLEKFIVIGTDITERKKAEKALLESQERFALVMEGTNDGIWDWNILTDKVYYSPHFFELLNYSKNHRDEDLEFFVSSLVPSARLHVWEKINNHLENKEPFDEEFQMQTRDGQHRWFRARGQAIWNDKGLPIRMSGSIMDVTERINAEKKIQNWNEELEQRVIERTDELSKAKELADSANRAKSAFLAAMSHELRTPMNGVVGMVDLLRDTALSHDQMKMVHTARDSALGLLTIIDDILDFSKIEAGKLEIEKIPFSVADVTESVVATLSNNAQRKNIGFEVFIDPTIPDKVVSDPIRLRQILYNLGGNAIKFTDNRENQPGQVFIRLEHVENESTIDSVNLKLRVIDNGIGISREVQDKLFEPFTQAERSTTRQYGGSGLGLSITQRLIEILNGKISVTSEVGRGSEFCVELIFPRGEGEDRQKKLHEYVGLIVHNNVEIAESLDVYLTSMGAQINVIKQKHLNVEMLDHYSPDFVIVDGKWIEKEKEYFYNKIIYQKPYSKINYLATSLRNASISPTCYEGVETIEVNPLLPSELLVSIEVALRIRKKENTDSGKLLSIPQFEAPTVEEARKNHELILLAEDNSTNREVIKRQLNRLGYAVELAHHGLQAFEKYKSGTYGLLLTDCHMPHMDGFQLTEAVRKHEQSKIDSKRTPIIAITANAIRGESERCYEKGMDDFLTKPVELKKIKEVLDKWLPIKSNENQQTVNNDKNYSEKKLNEVSNDLKAPILEQNSSLDTNQLVSLVGNDPEIIVSLLEDYQESSSEINEEIKIAWEKRDLFQLGKLGHKLKSAARTVGAARLGDICEVLQNAGKENNENLVDHTLHDYIKEFSLIRTEVNNYIESLESKTIVRTA